MPNPFSSYRLINAARIVKSNIRPNYIKEDITSLINTLAPLKRLINPNTSEGLSLSQQIVEKLNAKSDILDILIYFGYVRNNIGEYIYQLPRTDYESKRRESGVNEFQRFSTDLKNAQNGSLNGFEQFIRNSDSSDDSEPDEKPLPSSREIKNGNRKTLEFIETLKESLVTKYNIPPPHNFIRRKIALLAFQQKNSESDEVDDDLIDQTFDQKVLSLKQKDPQTNVPRTDHVYIECLIRGNFNEDKAFEILRRNRPNLEPSIEQTDTKTTTKTSIDNSIQPLQKYNRLLNQNKNENRFVRQFSREGDVWENVKHLVPAVQQLRKKYNNTNSSEVFSKMYRLLYSELSHIIGRQVDVKIEMFASMLCESSLDSIENLDIITIKNILGSSDVSQINDNFKTYAMNSLSAECPICVGSFPRSKMESMLLCNHMCCLDCLKNYYRTNIDKIQDIHSINILTCFMEPHAITDETHHIFFTYLEAKLNQWFPTEPELLKKYHDKIFNATSGKQIKKCGNSKCISSFFVDDNNEIARVRCPHCAFAQCGQCCRKWHPDHNGMDCNGYEEWLIDNDPDDPHVQLMKYLSTTGIACPNKDCPMIFEYKAGGCEHFTCNSCKTEFCRMCSALFYSTTKNPECPIPDCKLKETKHAHCSPNCFRETRIGKTNAIIKLLTDNRIDVTKELQKKPVSTNKKCPVEDCGKPTLNITGDRFCETCYQQFLSLFIWNHQIKPWTIYEDNNLEQMLKKASVGIPAKANRQKLIELCDKHLSSSLGKPHKITKPRV